MSETENTPLLNKEEEKVEEKSNYLSVENNQNLYGDSEGMSLYNENDILFFVKEDPKERTLKNRVGHMLHTTKWNIAILLMLACDVFIVVLELFVQLDEKKQCTPPGMQPPQSAGHDKFVTVVHHLGFVSDVFLCIFTTEVVLHIYCFGVKYLFEAWINFIDSLTVIITFIVTIAITFYSVGDEAQNLVDILIILRFWRIFCLVESVVNATQLEANLRFKEILVDLNAEVRILENRKNCYAEKLTELGYDLSKLENDYLFPKRRAIKNEKESENIL
ncbi:hypothetical protein PIROE2DRAFT_3104 [Piromyces sp. E2]|nr:hypothetical protein PIROE2DRAFT_3104 [Piromyces sp. E2]|eukprot:OUM69043.1 hypothetical protein PIROE2DRAFT_3104 [Piromyces sp. E2]